MFRAWIPTYTLLFLITACAQTVQSELRIILVGKTGSGKSTAGNTIFGKEVFKNHQDATSVCQCEEGVDRNGRHISIVNTPELFDSDDSRKRYMCAVIHSIPGPHAFLLVINVKARLTDEERAGVKWIEDHFGLDASMYTILLFTHNDELGGKSLEEYISESEDLRRLKHQCGGRYHAFNKKQLKDKSQVNQLLEKIDKMVEGNGKKYYTNDMYREVKEKLEEVWNFRRELNKYKGAGQNREIEKKMGEEEKRKCKEYIWEILSYLIPSKLFGAIYSVYLFTQNCGFECLYDIVFEEFLNKFFFTNK